MKFIKITSEGSISTIELRNPIYKSLQEEVGGYIEIVRPRGFDRPYCMIIDEEGLFKDGFKINQIGSYLYGYHEHGQPIVGDVVIAKEIETFQGRDISTLQDEEIEEILNFIKNLNIQEGVN